MAANEGAAMAGTATFEEFVSARSHSLFKLAYGLTREHAMAEDLLQTALIRAWSSWKRISGDPEPYVRKIIVNTYSSWWHRRWNGEHPADVLPERAEAEPQAAVDNRDEVWKALCRLPKRQQAVLVLRYFEDLSEAQIAETLGMARGTVKSYAAKGLLALRGELNLGAIPAAGHNGNRLGEVAKRITRRRRNKVVAAAIAIIALLALILSGAPIFGSRALEPVGPPEFAPDQHGYHIAAQKYVLLTEDTSTFIWVPSTLDTAIFMACQQNDPNRDILMAAAMNGSVARVIKCDGTFSLAHPEWAPLEEGLVTGIGLQPGVPVTVVFRVYENGPKEGQEPLPRKELPGGWAALGIGERLS